jgi:hypothetical protein
LDSLRPSAASIVLNVLVSVRQSRVNNAVAWTIGPLGKHSLEQASQLKFVIEKGNGIEA